MQRSRQAEQTRLSSTRNQAGTQTFVTLFIAARPLRGRSQIRGMYTFSVVRSLALFCRPLRGYMSSTWPAVAHRAHAICSHDSSGLLRLRLHVPRRRPWRARACLPPPLSLLDLLAVDSTLVVASSLDTGGGGLVEVTVVDWWVWYCDLILIIIISGQFLLPGPWSIEHSSCSAAPLRCRKPETQQQQEQGGAKCCMFGQAHLCTF
jgi:hypothetical protein